MRRLFVTGVPGWLTDAFLNAVATNPPQGLEEVRCLVLPGASAPRLPASLVRFSFITGRLEDEQVLAAATTGCDAVLHAAGLLHVRRTKDWYQVNTEGTRRLVSAAASAGVKRFVLISSNAAAGRSSAKDRLMLESDPARPLSHYGRSKLLAEQIVLRSTMEGVVIRPCMFYGPPVPIRHVDIYRRILTGRMPQVGHGYYARSVTHIENLLQGCFLALTHPRAAGEVYYIADEPVYTTREVVEAMAEALEVTPRYLRLPGFIAPVAYWGDRLLAATGLYWQNLHLVGEADWHVGVSIAKARSKLGYAPSVTLKSGMKNAVQWCRAQKFL